MTRPATITSVSDSAGQHLPGRRADTPRQRPQPGDLLRQEHRRAAPANTVTVTFSKAVPYADVRILEYSGLDRAARWT